MADTFAPFAAQYKPRIDNALTDLLQYPVSDQPYNVLRRDISQLIARGGKRLRPLLCTLTYQGYGGTSIESALPIAAALELLHAYLLIHDDIIDRDYQRWHGPNVTGVYFERYSSTMPASEAMHFAQSQALLAGDICHEIMLQTVVRSNLSAKLRLKILEYIVAATDSVLIGETNDTGYSLQTQPPTEIEVLELYRQKTASYSFVLPLQIGAVLAGVATAEIDLLTALAQDIGVAYQLQDDLLGIFSDQQTTGKPVGNDIRESKQTVLLLATLNRATTQQQKQLRNILGTADVSPDQIEQVRQIMVACGAQAYVLKIITDLTERALESLQNTSLHNETKTIFRSLTRQLMNRTQ